MRIRKLLLMIVNAFVFIVAFAALVISILNGLQIVSNLPQNWFPILTVVLLADLVLYNVLEKRTVLEGIQSRLDLVGRGSTVEVVPNRGELYQYAIDAASEGTRLNPIRHIKLYAPLGFRQVDNDKRRWLDALKQLVIERRVIDVEAIYGLPQEKTDLKKVANFLMQFFYYAKNEDQTACIRSHVFVRGITLGGPGLGIPRGFGLIIVEDRLLLIGYTVSRGDEQLQKSLAIRDKAAIKDLSDWFDSHVYVGGGLKVLQEPAAGNKLILREELSRILHGQKVPEAQIEQILSNREMSYDEIRALEASTSAPSQPTAQGTS